MRDYTLKPTNSRAAKWPASNRQRKKLRLFGVKFPAGITSAAAGVQIDVLMQFKENFDRWEKYLYLTKDFDNDSPELKDFDRGKLDSVEIPEGWSAKSEQREVRANIVRKQLEEGSPFDNPPPDVVFSGKKFMFTGKLTFGKRSACQAAVEAEGGIAPD